MNSNDEKIATQILIQAGNARKFVEESLNYIATFEFDIARNDLEKARQEIIAAHHAQTDLITAEARGDHLEISLLLTHAQDTLMIAMSQLQIAKHLLSMFEKVFKILKNDGAGDLS